VRVPLVDDSWSTVRVRRRRTGLPDGWHQIVQANVALWELLDPDERQSLETTTDWLLRHKRWEAAEGFVLSDEIRVTIAAQAALMIHGLSVDEYREVGAIIVYPTQMQSRGTYAGPVRGTVVDGDFPIYGEAHGNRGPVLIAWDQARAAARHPGRGHNVVFHEFAHKIDMLDHIVDGTPPLGRRGDFDRWVAVCTEAYEALREGADRPPLQPYGATNPAEFFAVATEAFFDVPMALEANEPDLFEVLRDFYRQDPAERARRSSAESSEE
jgi:Mlc titration factor MtfA (ptsG expression regulator)